MLDSDGLSTDLGSGDLRAERALVSDFGAPVQAESRAAATGQAIPQLRLSPDGSRHEFVVATKLRPEVAVIDGKPTPAYPASRSVRGVEPFLDSAKERAGLNPDDILVPEQEGIA